MDQREGQTGGPADDRVLNPHERLGAYRIVRFICEGGMGRIYHALDLLHGQDVALKVLHQRYSRRPDLLRRFEAEALAAASVQHPNILEVKNFHEDKSQRLHFLVMELLEGTDLQQRLAQEGALQPSEALPIARQTAAALDAVHSAGIAHRDLKPENIFLLKREGEAPTVKLLDFGLAKLTAPRDDEQGGFTPQESLQGEVFGTPAYMSPEQACGRAVDHRSDIYSFGVILFEMVTGVVPFEGGSFGELLIKHTLMTPPLPSAKAAALNITLPPGLDALILKCLEKGVDARPSSMAVVERELAALEAQSLR